MAGRALLVEEDEATANTLVPLLHKVGIEVEWVADAAAAAGRLEVPSGLDAAIVESAVAADGGLDLIERARAAGLCAVLLLGDGEQAPPGAHDVALAFPIQVASLYAALGNVADAAPAPSTILTPPLAQDDVMPPPTWSIPEGESPPQQSGGEGAPRLSPAASTPQSSAPQPSAPQPSAPKEEPATDATDPALAAASSSRVVKGNAALEQGRLELAIIELDSAVALDPQNAAARGYAAWARFSRVRDVAKTVGALHQNLVEAAEASNTASVWILAAEVAIDLGLIDVAKKRARKVLDLCSDDERALEIVAM